MKLYFHPLSTYSQKVVMGFHEKQASFTPEIVSLQDPASRAAYLAVNPLGKLPTLVLDDGYSIPESSIILEWLDTHVSTGNRLIPDDKDLARRTRFHDRLADLYVNNPTATLFFDSQKPEAQRNPAAVKAAHETLDTMFGILDKAFAKNTWALGEIFSMADVAMAPTLGYLRRVKPFTAHKNLVSYAGRLFERPSYQKVAADAAPYLAAMKG
ncbi:MAG: glutathione S-transferase family protein [Myxococcales bacterium]|nr:glutathione S-transferase family protein [Myxococcales bacterium]